MKRQTQVDKAIALLQQDIDTLRGDVDRLEHEINVLESAQARLRQSQVVKTAKHRAAEAVRPKVDLKMAEMG